MRKVTSLLAFSILGFVLFITSGRNRQGTDSRRKPAQIKGKQRIGRTEDGSFGKP
ncbi:hypothetical protein [Siminovitchia fortis]|uniref:hypothetical protein n=1 Tax=Siminovitchia fortis TaxID=254758 RepID=UPI00164353FA|nr:hypothetical protein [Siminovitchia fortis]